MISAEEETESCGKDTKQEDFFFKGKEALSQLKKLPESFFASFLI